MIANTVNTVSRIIVRVLRWSSAGNAIVWPERRSGSYMTLQVLSQQSALPLFRTRSPDPAASFTKPPRIDGDCLAAVP
jgi:hypothetical protein